MVCGTIIAVNKDVQKIEALRLRERGYTYAEIKKALGANIPKSTLSHWLRGIELNDAQKKRIGVLRLNNIKKAQEKALVVHKQQRIIYLKALESRNQHLKKFLKNNDIAKLLLAMLYLGEGAKWKSHRGLQLGSSNPEIMRLYLSLLERCFGVNRKKLTAMIYHRADQDLPSLVHFWSEYLDIPKANFYKSKPDMRTSGRKTWEDYHGVCAVFGPGTEVQLELELIAKMFFGN